MRRPRRWRIGDGAGYWRAPVLHGGGAVRCSERMRAREKMPRKIGNRCRSGNRKRRRIGSFSLFSVDRSERVVGRRHRREGAVALRGAAQKRHRQRKFTVSSLLRDESTARRSLFPWVVSGAGKVVRKGVSRLKQRSVSPGSSSPVSNERRIVEAGFGMVFVAWSTMMTPGSAGNVL
jgi:hypothetical protein